jgi:hypothetical protein
VHMMTLNGVKQDEQARALRMSKTTLTKYFREELDLGKIVTTANVAGALYRNAMDGNVSAQIFWMKAQGGWREADRLEITGAEGKDLLTDTEKEQRLAAILMAHKGRKTLTKGTTVETFTKQENPN